jgi:hypothetical protein
MAEGRLSNAEIVNRLYTAACADSVHDFKISNKIYSNTKSKDPTLNDVIITLPKSTENITSIPNEETLLTGILGNSIQDIIEELSNSVEAMQIQIQGVNTYNCEVRLLKHNGDKNIRNINDEITVSEYRKFFDLEGSDPLNFVIDAQIVGINTLFGLAKLDGDNVPLQVNNIINREVVNDGAPKTYDIKKFNSSESAKYNIKYDISNELVTYNSFNSAYDDEFHRNMFFSTLDFCMSPMKLGDPKKPILPRIDVDILNKDKKIVNQTSDPHKDNVIARCLSYIRKYLGSGGDAHIKCSSFFQSKRSGDWLQALSCLDTGRRYSDGLIGKLKLVTHDRILLWYALFMGIDVIFTCTAPPASGSKYDYNIPDDEENDDDISKDLAGVKRQKILLYFTSSKETADQRLNRLTNTAKVYSGKLEEFEQYKNQYNTWVRSAIEKITLQIQEVIEAITIYINNMKQKADIPKWLTDKTHELIKLYWRYTAIHYVNIEIPVYPGGNANLQLIDTFISNCLAIETLKRSITNEQDLLYKSKAYEVNEEYNNIINPFQPYEQRIWRNRDPSNTPEVRVLKLCNYLQFRLPNEYIQNLSNQLETISKSLYNKQIFTEKLAIRNIVNLLNSRNIEPMSEIIHMCLKLDAINSVNNKYIENTQRDQDLTGEKDDVDKPYEEAEEIAIVDVNKTRGRAFVTTSINYSIYGEKFMEYVKNDEEGKIIEPIEEVAMQEGGNRLSNLYMLYSCYLYTLMNSLNGFDTSESTDYIYYDALTRLIVSSVNTSDNDIEFLLAVPYSILPGEKWYSNDKLMKSKKFKDCVSIVAHNVALQSINLREGVIPYTNKIETNLLDSVEYTKKFEGITNRLRKVSFKDRQSFLIKELSNIINTLKIKEVPELIPPPDLYKIKMETRKRNIRNKQNHLNGSIEHTRKLIKISQGGNKRYKKSPRRKTLRKTRKNKH